MGSHEEASLFYGSEPHLYNGDVLRNKVLKETKFLGVFEVTSSISENLASSLSISSFLLVLFLSVVSVSTSLFEEHSFKDCQIYFLGSKFVLSISKIGISWRGWRYDLHKGAAQI